VIKPKTSNPIKLQLARNLVKTVKRGHAWVYADALRQLPKAAPGSPAVLFDNRGGRAIARGYYDPESPIAFRVCTTNPDEELDRTWAENRMETALSLREAFDFPGQQTSAYRLFNGEGDGLPGLVCDVYSQYAVLATDGPGADQFWDAPMIAHWLNQQLDIQGVLLKSRGTQGKSTVPVFGQAPQAAVPFTENGINFSADLFEGQKTGFYLDQRDNRSRTRRLASGKRVLNVFGYTGGFSVYAGLGGAAYVTTVDQAAPALASADLHWQMNALASELHIAVCDDAFEFLKSAGEQRRSWDLVIMDPPSFAPSQAALPQARQAYTRLIEMGARVTVPGGLLATASCSSHVDQAMFLEIIEQSISQARRKATVLGIHGQPADHPAPLVMPELRYLKFVLLSLD
jgi:23S rRNA (cytosine1962-C5)-methyltransferase